MSLQKRTYGVSAISVLAAFSGAAGCEDAATSFPIVPTSCPDALPAEGDSCGFREQCVYARCGWGDHPTIQASCADGKVDIRQTSCNPPFPIDGGPDGSVDGSVDGSANPPVDASTVVRVQGMDGG